MKRKIKRIEKEVTTKASLYKILVTCLLLITAGSSSNIAAQCKLQNSAMKTGEDLEYTLYFYWGILWKEVGTASYTTSTIKYDDKESLKLNLIMSTNDVADNFFKMRDTITSIISTDLEPLYYRKAAEEGKRFTIDEAKYTYRDNKSFAELKRTWRDGKSETYNESSTECIYDMLSVMGKAKALNNNDFKKGERFNIEMTTGKKVEQLILEYKGIENVKADNKKSYNCMVYTLLKHNKKNKLKDFITFYISNDADKILVKLKLELNFGSAQVTLKEIKHL